MDAFGYQTDDDGETPRALRETSLLCEPAELDQLIAFLTHVRGEVARRGGGACHFHYRDWRDDAHQGSDLIIVFSGAPATRGQ